MDKKFSYDRIAYPKKLFMQTHPEHLATLGIFFGMNPPPVENCRVLELGCGDGTSLLAHAFNLPNARFVGVDLGENHISRAKKSAAELNLKNIEFHGLDLMNLSREEFGGFDYITAHGLFSWVPEIVREKILSLCAEMLAPNGIGYISFNAFPGAHQRQTAGDIMRYFTREVSDSGTKVEQAVRFLRFVAGNTVEAEVYQAVLEKELDRFLTLEPAGLFHDDLAQINQPFYFHEFASLLENHDFQFLAEADLYAMFTTGLSPEAAAFIDSLDDIIEREQYLDFFHGHTFRRVLFCRKHIELARRIEPAVLNNFLLNSEARPVSESFDATSSEFETFIGSGGNSVQVDHPLAKAALFYLGRIWARSAAFADTLEAAQKILISKGYETDNWQAEFETAGAILLQICCQTNLLKLHLRQSEPAAAVAEKPEISEFIRWQLFDSKEVLTLYNVGVSFEDDFTRHLLNLLDGTRDRSELTAGMLIFIESNGDSEYKEVMPVNLPERIDAILGQLVRVGMLKK